MPAAGTLIGPLQVRSRPATDGFDVVAPVVEPGVYVKPSGSVSATELSVTGVLFGLLIVIV